MRIIVFALFFALAAIPALAENPTTVSFGCTPWDGTSLQIKVGAPDIGYDVTIWGSGLEQLRNGAHKIEIDNARGIDASGTGSADACGTGNHCYPHNVTVDFEKAELRPGGTVKGLIKGTVPFEGTIAQQAAPCGQR